MPTLRKHLFIARSSVCQSKSCRGKALSRPLSVFLSGRIRIICFSRAFLDALHCSIRSARNGCWTSYFCPLRPLTLASARSSQSPSRPGCHPLSSERPYHCALSFSLDDDELILLDRRVASLSLLAYSSHAPLRTHRFHHSPSSPGATGSLLSMLITAHSHLPLGYIELILPDRRVASLSPGLLLSCSSEDPPLSSPSPARPDVTHTLLSVLINARSRLPLGNYELILLDRGVVSLSPGLLLSSITQGLSPAPLNLSSGANGLLLSGWEGARQSPLSRSSHPPLWSHWPTDE